MRVICPAILTVTRPMMPPTSVTSVSSAAHPSPSRSIWDTPPVLFLPLSLVDPKGPAHPCYFDVPYYARPYLVPRCLSLWDYLLAGIFSLLVDPPWFLAPLAAVGAGATRQSGCCTGMSRSWRVKGPSVLLIPMNRSLTP
ncbi:hypothetical protein Tco_1120983 [Tanacetum coccineum]|uniref:Uncharacterized protein n=1 Tax=Tanacetum coccineum TaxID=301880 RepID=A0ABQ5IWF2_9ASTR